MHAPSTPGLCTAVCFANLVDLLCRLCSTAVKRVPGGWASLAKTCRIVKTPCPRTHAGPHWSHRSVS